ncbi:class I SAM-dependent methyltransferase [Actinomadura sp. 7K507]|uniref:class I SAM-dependent methyltransferase n=1 Tax=Actinomadura sp. 7K507 TaxID=2530365 RepID=UPI00104A58E0|nr:class I SAM-dependent methyltransferase [Actinomadura sp. 7K507]TDC83191.1 class I SAM-dependent methyltransferase [Actinomadura sp. 7K507]
MAWQRYLKEFHDQNAAITEHVLGRCADRDGRDPYGWLLEAVPPGGRVLDLACGSAPLWPGLRDRPYLGADTSPAELAVARRAGAGPLVRADASALPVAPGGVDVVVCSMGLMILTPLSRALAEIARVLAPGGVLVATVPDRRPLRPLDLAVAGGLLAALGAGLGYPNDRALRHLPDLLVQAGLRLDGDERHRYGYRLRSAEDADRFASSLYLPGLPPSRHRRARKYLRALSRLNVEAPVPIRRIVAQRTAPPDARTWPS